MNLGWEAKVGVVERQVGGDGGAAGVEHVGRRWWGSQEAATPCTSVASRSKRV
jgi:hypothetical protein